MKNLSYKRLSLALFITYFLTLAPSCFERLQAFDAEKSEIILGFPFDFYTVKFTVAQTFAIHFNILGFAADIVVIYLILTLCVWAWEKIKR